MHDDNDERDLARMDDDYDPPRARLEWLVILQHNSLEQQEKDEEDKEPDDPGTEPE